MNTPQPDEPTGVYSFGADVRSDELATAARKHNVTISIHVMPADDVVKPITPTSGAYPDYLLDDDTDGGESPDSP